MHEEIIEEVMTLKSVFNNNSAEMCERGDKFMNVIAFLQSSERYANNPNLQKYIELTKLVDFTWIADQTHLATNYGFPTDEMIEDSKRYNAASKELIDTKETRRLEKAWSLKENVENYHNKKIGIDMLIRFKERLSMSDKSAWYSEFSLFFTNAFLEIRLMIDTNKNILYYNDKNNKRQSIVDYSTESFVDFLSIVMTSSEVLDLKTDWNVDLLTRLVKFLENSEIFSIQKINNDIIQFLDCYVLNGVFIEGQSKQVPRFYIDRKVWDVVQTRKTSVNVRQVDEFLLHLSDYDNETKEVLLSHLSTFLINSGDLKMSMKAVAVVLYGASGENGKSLFNDLMKKIFTSDDHAPMPLQEFNNQNYMLPSACDKLYLYDEDASDLYMDSSAASNFKQFVYGQALKSRDIYEKARNLRPRASYVLCTNHLPSSVDKTDGFNRRFSIFTQTSKLINSSKRRSEDWFKAIRSDDAAQYLLEILVLAHLENMKFGRLKKKSERMREINEDFVEKNDTAVMFVRAVSLSEIIGKPVKQIREVYESWCDDNGVTALKNKFNTTLETKFGLRRKQIQTESTALSEMDKVAFQAQGKTKISCWVHSDENVNISYKERLARKEDPSIEETIDNADIADLTIDQSAEKIVKLIKSPEVSEDEVRCKVKALTIEMTDERSFSITQKVIARLSKERSKRVARLSDLRADTVERLMKAIKYDRVLSNQYSDKLRAVTIYTVKNDPDE